MVGIAVVGSTDGSAVGGSTVGLRLGAIEGVAEGDGVNDASLRIT